MSDSTPPIPPAPEDVQPTSDPTRPEQRSAEDERERQRRLSRGETFYTSDLEVLYRDDRLIAIDKPSGLLVHHSHIARDVRVVALQLVRRIVRRRVHPVHRLDRGTSGVLLFALDPEAARATADLFAARQMRKTYCAIVRGHPPESGHIDRPLNQSKTGERRPATTDFIRRETVELPIAVGRFPTTRYGLLEMSPHTGRRHQLRRHCCHIHHPIVGDTTHGDAQHNRLFRREWGAHRLLLFAARLRFEHPFTGAPIDLRCRPDPTLTTLCEAFGWRDPLARPYDAPGETMPEPAQGGES